MTEKNVQETEKVVGDAVQQKNWTIIIIGFILFG